MELARRFPLCVPLVKGPIVSNGFSGQVLSLLNGRTLAAAAVYPKLLFHSATYWLE